MTGIRPDRLEAVIQILILLLIAGMAGAASFTHVHDWTMHNAPAGTGTWFGWANAIISELTPAAAGIEIRRRKRQHRPAAYPLAVLIGAAALSLTAQVAEARDTLAGWLAAVIPALAFLALTKLVLSRTSTQTAAPHLPAASDGNPAPAVIPAARNPAPAPAQDGGTSGPDPAPALPGQLVIGARMAAFTHQQATGQPITPDGLASHLNIPPALAGTLLHHIGGTPPQDVTAINGTAPGGNRP